MINSRLFILLGLLLFAASLFTPCWDAAAMAPTDEKKLDAATEGGNQVVDDDAKEAVGGRTCRYRCCLRGRVGCIRCCAGSHQFAHAHEEGRNQVDGSKQFVGRCRYGCCGWGKNGCIQCCRRKNPPQTAGEISTGKDPFCVVIPVVVCNVRS
ncbi:CYC02 protein-like isoform X3 [Malania oleifera]|uniref:CYC02 protein-like isoform X3 n=1 Tax=Malania oleifera TaxID=397392 RepID=UPI0025AE1D82|nr:CYC02 protein-like isoform X3 [Malania oleifera]